MISSEDIRAITERLKQPDIEKVILFGSYAHGTPHKDSDLDLIVYTQGMYQKFNDLDSSFSREIAKKGVVLYEKNYQGLA